MNALLLCQCQGMDPQCCMCKGHEKLEVTQTFRIPHTLDFCSLKFDPVAGLFQVFQIGDAVIGVGNIEFKPELRSFYIYDLQSFWGQDGHKLMLETMYADTDVDFVRGKIHWEECIR